MGIAQAQALIKKIATPDTIGPAECPILYRWTLFPLGFGSHSSSTEHLKQVPDWLPKLLLHHFVAQADERHSHDHPRGFWTFVIKGGYDDMTPCRMCAGVGKNKIKLTGRSLELLCAFCLGHGVILGEVMTAGMLRYRPAHHTHRTRVHESGAWTIVLMGPKVREWGFHLGNGKWMDWKTYFKEIGYGMRCV